MEAKIFEILVICFQFYRIIFVNIFVPIFAFLPLFFFSQHMTNDEKFFWSKEYVPARILRSGNKRVATAEVVTSFNDLVTYNAA